MTETKKTVRQAEAGEEFAISRFAFWDALPI